MSDLRVTVEWLRERRAYAAIIKAFVQAYPDGLDYDPTCARQAAEMLTGPLAPYMGWAIDQGLPPHRLTGGDFSTVLGGAHSTVLGGAHSTVSGGWRAAVTGGPHSTATGGAESIVSGGVGAIVTGGDYSTVTGGDYSAVTGGYGSAVAGGYRATVSGGYRATVTGGDHSILMLRHHDGVRWRLVTAYVGEDGIKAGVRYRLGTDGRFVRAEGVSDE